MMVLALLRGAFAATGGLFVSTEPPGATIALDGTDTGLLSPALVEGVEPGPHALAVVRGCEGAQLEVQVQADRIARAEPALAPAEGTLVVETGLEAARVLLDGALRGEGPRVDVRAACGAHDLRVEADGWHPHAERVELRPFGERHVAVTLAERLRGTLVVAPRPLEAEVALDGAPVSRGPVTLDDLDAGRHTVKVSLDAYLASSSEVELAPDEIKRLDVELRPATSTAARAGSDPLPAWKRASPGRLAVDTAATAGGLALAGLSAAWALQSQAAYQDYLGVTGNKAANEIWQFEVVPARRRAVAAGVGGGVLLLGSGVLWFTTDFTSVQVGGTW